MLAFVCSFAALSLPLSLAAQQCSTHRILKLPKVATKGELTTTDTAEFKMTEDALAEDTAALEDITQDRQTKPLILRPPQESV